jgi:hypothetical protein
VIYNKEYNNSNEKAQRVYRIYSVTAGAPYGDAFFEKDQITFAEADLLFDGFKRNPEYPVVLLDEGDITIRGYSPQRGEEREIRYDIINGLTKKLDRDMRITYKPISVQAAYQFHADSGRGWLEVPLKEVIDLGLKDNITRYSYIDNETAVSRFMRREYRVNRGGIPNMLYYVKKR